MCHRLFLHSFFCFLTLAFTLCFTDAKSQHKELHFTSLSSKDGLSSNTVHAILKDRFGLLWFATNEGLNKYNGTDFTVYQHIVNDSTSLQANEVVTLHEDKQGRLWVGTIGGGLHCYNRQKDSFQRFKYDNSLNGLTTFDIKAIQSDFLGNVWVGTLAGLNIVDPLTNSVTKFINKTDVPDVIRNGKILSLFEDTKKRMWIGTSEGLFLFDRLNNKFKVYLHNDNHKNSLVNNVVKTIAGDKRGNIWIGTAGGLSMLSQNELGFRNFNYKSDDPQTINSNFIYAIAAGPGNNLWIGTESGLSLLDINSGLVNRYGPDGRNVFSLSGKSVRSILYDKSGFFWVGTYEGGVNKFDRNLTFFGLKHSNAYDPYGLSGSVVTSFAEGRSGEIFVGTDGGGLNIFDRTTDRFQHFFMKARDKASSSGLSILTMAIDSSQNLWVGTFQDGLFEVNTKTGSYHQYLQGSDPFSVSHNEIFCLKTDSRGRVWIGTNGAGVNVFDPVSRKFAKCCISEGGYTGPKLPLNGFIRAIEEDKDGKIWICSYGSGIAVYNPVTNRFSVWNKLQKNLPSNKINSILQDSKGRIWVGTSGDGLVLLDPVRNSYRSFSINEGLANGVVHKIMEDSSGNLWLSTTKGVSYFNPANHKFINYNSFNGLQNNSFVQGSGLHASDGTLFFGGVEGFNYIDPRKLRTNRNLPAIIFTDLKVNNRTISALDSNIISADIAVAKDIHLDYKQNFSISYVALNYTNSKQNRYAYRLKGFESEWNEVGAKTTAYYTNISPGDYILEVRASNNDGIWNNRGTAIRIAVKSPLWMTVYACFLYVLVIVSALFYIRFRGIKKLQNKFAAEQIKKESDRLHQLDRMKIKFLTNLSHEFRTPISLILAPADKLLKQQKDDGVVVQVQMIRRNARRLLNLVNQLLDVRKMEERELRLHPSDGDMVSFIQDVVESFRDLSESKNIYFSFKSQPKNLNIAFDHDKMERIFFNLLSNAFKFTPDGGAIEVFLGLGNYTDNPDSSYLFIKVADTGIGIPSEKREEIFELFFQNKVSNSILNQGSGIGLSIVREFIHMHGGTISVESEEGKGSEFTVEFPYSQSETAPQLQADRADVKEDKTEMTADKLNDVAVNTGLKDDFPIVLLVEDNDDFRFYLKDNLRSAYRILEAANGREGWQKALAHHPDLIVSDISMPFVDGIEFSRKVKSDKRTSHIPIILLTAAIGDYQELEGLSSGANDYLTKPFNFEILQTKIKNLMAYNVTLKAAYSKQLKVVPGELGVQSKNEKLLKDVVKYIEDNLINSQLSVEDLSKYIGMSRSTLYHKLLEITGQTPVELIRSIKLEKAAALLEKSDMNIAEIAYKVGFASPNYFSKAFKVKYDVVPSEYINLKRKVTEAGNFTNEH